MSQPVEYEDECDHGQRLDKDAEEKLVQRLYYSQMEQKEMRESQRAATLEKQRAQQRKTISKADQEKLTQRIYDQQLQRFEQSRQERERKTEEEAHKRDIKLDQADIDSHVKRMYDDEIAKSRATRAELTRRYVPEQEEKKMPKKDFDEMVTRLYHVDNEKRDEELFQKWVYPNDPKKTTISKAELDEMASRLCTTKGAAS